MPTSSHWRREMNHGTQDEFADYEGEPLYETVQFRWSNLLNPPAVRAIVALVGGFVLISSERSVRTVALVLGIGLVAWAAAELLEAWRRSGRVVRVGRAMALLALGVALLTWPQVTGTAIARLVAAGLGLVSLQGLVRAVRADGGNPWRWWWAIRALLIGVLSIAMWIAPETMLNLGLIVVAFVWILTGLAAIIGNLSTAESDVGVTDVWPRFFDWLDQRPESADDRTQLYAKLFYEAVDAKRRLSRFFILMGFATAIAAFGIIADSTAVVIGAMLVAPLMTPLMGTSLSLVMGWPNRALRSALVALGGVALAIGLSAVFGAVSPFGVDPVANSQVASRIVPTMVDLIIAVAAGGAGAFAVSRPDVSDALPGVAVAIALVPPLAVAGLMIQAGLTEEAVGALLLFTTNMVAILLVGAGVFVLTGVVPVRQLIQEREWIRNAAALIAVLAIIVIVVLGTTSEELRAQAFDRGEVEAELAEWIGTRALEVVSFQVGADDVEVVVVGEDEPAPVEDLARGLESELGRDLVLTVRWVPERRFVVDGTTG